MILGFVWPFAFQYGRMSGWYCVCAFFVSWLTSIYLALLRGDGRRSWFAFAVASVLLLWSNYFGVVILALLLVDLFVFHRDLAVRRTRSLITVAAVIVISFLPLVGIALRNLTAHTAPAGSGLDIKGAIAAAGYPIFSILASAAVAPWYSAAQHSHRVSGHRVGLGDLVQSGAKVVCLLHGVDGSSRP